MALRCRLFGHDWLHLDTAFMDADADKLRSSHLCDRCEEKRTIVMSVERTQTEAADTLEEQRERIKSELDEMKHGSEGSE